jgi:hypothetical protein
MAYNPVFYATDDDKLNIARGLTKYSQVVNIFGYNANVSTSFVPLWEANTNYPFPTANVGMEIKSSDATDTDVTIKIIGLDSNYESLVEVVNLNGTTEVNLTKEFFRINTMITTSGNANGMVTLCGNTGSPIYGKIRRGDGKNQTSFYTVPAGHNFYLYRIDAFSATANANKYLTFRNFVRQNNGVELRVAETTFVNQMNIQRRLPFKYSGNTDIIFQAKSSAQLNEVGIFAEGILIEEGQHFE